MTTQSPPDPNGPKALPYGLGVTDAVEGTLEARESTQPPPELSQKQKVERLFNALPPIFRDVVPNNGYLQFDILLPWVADGKCYACDGRIIVAIEATEAIAALVHEAKPIRGRLPDPKEVWSAPSLYDTANPVQIPGAAAFEICPECQGFGRVADVPYGVSYVCEDCDGSGKVSTCEAVVIDQAMTIGSHFAAILNRHHASAYLPLVPNKPGSVIPLAFTCDHGVSGRLMPLSFGG